MNKIVAIVGMCGSGKSVLNKYFEEKGYKSVYFGGIVLEKLKENNLEKTPENERYMREKIRKEYGMAACAVLSIPKIKELLKTDNVVIDGLYSWDEFKILKENFDNMCIIAVVVNKDLRYNRLAKREERSLSNKQAEERDISEIENLSKGGPIAFADYFILNSKDMNEYLKDIERVYQEIEAK